MHCATLLSGTIEASATQPLLQLRWPGRDLAATRPVKQDGGWRETLEVTPTRVADCGRLRGAPQYRFRVRSPSTRAADHSSNSAANERLGGPGCMLQNAPRGGIIALRGRVRNTNDVLLLSTCVCALLSSNPGWYSSRAATWRSSPGANCAGRESRARDVAGRTARPPRVEGGRGAGCGFRNPTTTEDGRRPGENFACSGVHRALSLSRSGKAIM